jgi:tetratricopeptide (TPR) repeat protein
MRIPSRPFDKAWGQVVVIVALTTLVIPFGACQQLAGLKARKAFKEANAFYQQGDYRRAAEKYEETLREGGPELEAVLTPAYFFLGNSYDNMYRPSRKGEADNDAFLTKAIENYKKSAEIEKENPVIRQRALEYLIAAYGPDKLNDPNLAEPVVQKMIELDPQDPNNYFVLSKIYEDAGDYERAEATLLKARDTRPNDASVYTTLAAYYNRQGEFEKTIAALEQRAAKEPQNPEAHYTIASYYWDKAYRDFKLKDPEKKEMVQKGIAEVDKALQIKNDYLEAVVYKGLLLRLQANLEKEPAKQQALLKEAEALQTRAKELQKKKTAGVGD